MKNFYFLGDSICFGQYHSIEKTWVVAVAKTLNEIKKDSFVFMNPSIMGNTSRDVLNRMQNEVLLRFPDIIYVQLGMNDCNYWETVKDVRVSVPNFVSNLEEIKRLAELYNVKILFGTNHLSKKNEEYDFLNQSYNKWIRQFCREKKVFMIDHEAYWVDNNVEGVLPDGVHLNAEGHKAYYDCFIENILQWL